MRVLVCGGRRYRKWDNIVAALEALHAKKGIELLIQGGAQGADRGAAEWAWREGIPVHTYAAQWNRDGLAAGPIRNQRMLDEGKPDGVVAFPGGAGTSDMIQRAEKAGLIVWQPFPETYKKSE